MALVAFGVLWAGYTLVWWGAEQVKGCTNVGFADLVVPGRYAGCDARTAASPGAIADAALKPAPGAGPKGTTPGAGGQSTVSPPSTEGYMSRTPK